jgi:PKHD-type hydroxylase
MLKNMIQHYEGVVPEVVCDYIVGTTPWGEATEALVALGEKGVNHGYRKTDVVFVNPLSLAGCILQSHLRDANIRAGWHFDLSFSEDIQMGSYIDGGHYDWHIDAFPPDQFGFQRKLSAVMFLSDPDSYEGGDFEIRKLEGFPKHPPKGSVIVFPSVLEHRVSPVTEGVRVTSVCWMLGPAFK